MEVIKHSLIADAAKWKQLSVINYQLSVDNEAIDWEDIVRHSITIKDRITTEDPTEKGVRKILNFGHTLGHAVESFCLETDKKLLHGEAIAVGMICESFLAVQKNLLSKEALSEVTDYVKSVFGKASIPVQDFHDIIELTKQAKK